MIRRYIRWMAGFALVAVLVLLAFFQFDLNVSRKPVAEKDDDAPVNAAAEQQPLTDTSGDSGGGQTAASGGSEGLGEVTTAVQGAEQTLPSVASVPQPEAGTDRSGDAQPPRTAQPDNVPNAPDASDTVDLAAQVLSLPSGGDGEPAGAAPEVPSLGAPETPATSGPGVRTPAVDNVVASPAPSAPLANVGSAGSNPAASGNPGSDEPVERASDAAEVAGSGAGVGGLPSVGDQAPDARPAAAGTLAALDSSGGSGADSAASAGNVVVPTSKPELRLDRQAPDLHGNAPSAASPDLPAVSEPEPEPEDEVLKLAAVQPAQQDPPEREPGGGSNLAGGGTPEGQPETPDRADDGPVFDIVRVDRDGQTVIAGSARPDEKVEVLLDGVVVGETVADATGQFVAIVFANLSGSAQRLELRTVLPEDEVGEPDPVSDVAPQVASNIGDLSNPVIGGENAPVAPAAENAGVARNQPVNDGSATVAAPDQVATVAAAPQMQRHAVSAPVIILPDPEASGAPTLVQPQRDGLAMLQPPEREILGVVLDSISYDDSGAVILSGRGVVERVIRIYANGEEAGAARVDPDGRWVWASDVADPQNIKLFRLDELGPEGSVTSRIETPFTYERFAPKLVRDREVEIQRGDMLWRIAEQFYGEGIRYSMIYGANSELIRDPDLIYPGQVFTIPELVDAN